MESEYESNIRDNRKRGNVLSFLKKSISDNYSQDGNTKSKLKIVSAYFTIHAFNELREELKNKVSETKFILGEPSSIDNLCKQNKRLKTFKIEDENITLSNVLNQNNIAKECYKWLKSPSVEIRTAPKKDNKTNLIHGKMYHIEKNDDARMAEAIVGSSNFTRNGLGIGDSSNFELNTIVDSKSTIKDLKKWFEELWNENTEDAKKEILKYLETIYKENSPEELYYKTLYHLFEERLADEEQEDVENNKHFVQTKIWKMLFDFQKDAVNSIVKKLYKYNGCILADSVGLGKTYTALGVAQYFICDKKQRVLVLAPKRLENNWKIYEEFNPKNIFKEDNLRIKFLAHTGLTAKEIDKDIALGDFDLVIIDESHNFRNATPSKKDKNGNVTKESRYDKLLNQILKEGARAPKVLLLSATPVNTKLSKDLYNQIRFITFDNNNAFEKTLDIRNFETVLKTANTKYKEWALKKERKKEDLLKMLNPDFFKLMDAITIARSRRQIKNNYSSFDNKFPKRNDPDARCIDVDINNKFPSFKEIDAEIDKYQLSLFNPTKYLNKMTAELGNEKLAGNMTQDQRENYLIGMMKAGFLKRLESSIASFTISMKNTIDKIDARIKLIDLYKETQNGNIDTDFEDDIDDEDIRNSLYDNDKYIVGKKLQYSLSELNIDDWKKDLIKDKEQIQKLLDIAKDITPERDKKLAELRTIIENKSRQKNKKILLFTTYADTAEYLYNNLESYVTNELGLNIALVTGDKERTRSTCKDINNYSEILEYFSPMSKLPKEQQPNNEIDILIATDCISEGQNLQDCDMVINYDIHWNPVRLIQRLGRIDRIGSPNDFIQMICFWPTNDLDEYINLKNRVEARMVAADISACADDNPLEKASTQSDLTYRDKQLKKIMQEESIENIEEDNAVLELSDLSLEDFKKDLKDFVEVRKKDLKNTPNGICAIVPNIDNKNDKIAPAGIVFCLKQKNKSDNNKEHNELSPYYLVYIKKDGSVFYTFENARKILDIYKKLCLGKNQPIEDLCQKFNKNISTEEGLAMYNKLLKSAVDSTKDAYQADLIAGLRVGNIRRNLLIPNENDQVKSDKDFELITWLIIDGL